MSIKDRLIEFIEAKNLNKNKFEKMCGLSIGYIGNISKGLGAVGYEKISKAFPELNMTWLTFGEGEMLKHNFFVDNSQRDGSIKIIGENNKHIYGGNNRNTGNINRKDEHKENEAYKEVEHLKVIIAEKEGIINNLQEQLRAKDEQLQSKDKIINSLIAKIK